MTNTELIAARVGEGRGVDSWNGIDRWMDVVAIPDAERVFGVMQRWAKAKGWTLNLVDKLPVSPDGDEADIPDEAMASTQNWEKAIFVRTKATPSQRVYLAAHELGHAFGNVSDGMLEAGWIQLIRMGAVERRDVPKLRLGEAEAELTTSLVLMGLKATPNFDYFWNWGLTESDILNRKVRDGAERVASGILRAIEGDKQAERVAA